MVTSTYPPTTTGGVGEVVFNLQKNLIGLGADTHVFTCGRGNGNYPRTTRIPCGKRLFFPMSLPYYLRAIGHADFDIINIQQECGMAIAPFLLASKHRIKVVTTLHTSFQEESRALRNLVMNGKIIARPTLDEYLTKYVLVPVKLLGAKLDSKISDRIVASCMKTKEDCAREFEIPEERISVIYNGVDVARFNPKLEVNIVRDMYGLGDKPVLLWVGRGEIRKGLPFLISCLRSITTEIENLRLIVVGASERISQMNSLAARLGIRDNVIFAGRVSEALLPYYYSASDVVVLPSLYEGLPTVALEAMASGKPIVASSVGGVPEAVENNKNGILFEAEHSSQMVKSLIFLLQDDSVRKKMGKEGRAKAEKTFDWRFIARRYFEEFENML